MPHSTVLLDWGGVISPGGRPDELASQLKTNLDIPPERLQTALLAQTELLKRGKTTIEQFWNGLEDSLDVSVPIGNRDVWTKPDDLAPNAAITAFVHQLKEHGITVAILSNTFPKMVDDIRGAGWYDDFETVVLSSEVGMAKPDPKVYRYVLSLLECAPQEIIFVDDQQKCLDPAAAIGMTTVLAENPKQIIRDVTRLLGWHTLESLLSAEAAPKI